MQTNTLGWINGFIGMLIFSASLVATRAAVMDFDPIFLTCIRATIAAFLGLGFLIILGEKRPQRSNLISLLIVTIGVVVGFPLLTALALQNVTASYSTVFIGLLPLSTAIFAVLRAGERHGLAFWVYSVIGGALVGGFALTHGVETSLKGNVFMAGAILVCGLGYAEGAKLSRTLGGWQVISWALVMGLPAMLPLALYTMPATIADIGLPAWLGLFYVSTFSMLIGFVFWYRGLAQGGIAAVGQLQLLQPFFGLALAAILLRETISLATFAITAGVVLCVFGAKKMAR